MPSSRSLPFDMTSCKLSRKKTNGYEDLRDTVDKTKDSDIIESSDISAVHDTSSPKKDPQFSSFRESVLDF